MAKTKRPVTPAVRVLRTANISFVPFLYDYEPHGGTRQAAELFQVSEHMVIKTLIFETESQTPVIVLMHGDKEVSAKNLARIMGVKSVTPCKEATAQKLTGYMVGGISPFGTRTQMPVHAESSIFDCDRIFINGGKRGFMIRIAPSALTEIFDINKVNVAI